MYVLRSTETCTLKNAYQALQLYKSQTVIKTVNASFERMKKKKRERFGVFRLEDLGKYQNF